MTELYVETRGRGPDLVLLHGWGLNLRVWDGLTRELSKSFRVIAIDLPGHGRSAWNPKARTPAEQAWQVHAALASRSDRYSLLGWSLGGQIALDLAAAMPGSVERLVLVATTPRFVASEDWPYGMPATALERLAAQLRTNYKRTVSEFLELQVRGSSASERVLAELHGSLFSHGEAHPKALVAGLATLESSDLRSMLSLVRTPALVVAGQYDRVTLPTASRALAEALPDARYVEFRRAAHAPFLSHTAEFATLVTRFLRGEPVDTNTEVVPRAPAAESSGTGGADGSNLSDDSARAITRTKDDETDAASALHEALTAERILTSGEGDSARTQAPERDRVPQAETTVAQTTPAAGQAPESTLKPSVGGKRGARQTAAPGRLAPGTRTPAAKAGGKRSRTS
jgi:pimeloyl-[acyl-carrier protein] methyl ester esterase